MTMLVRAILLAVVSGKHYKVIFDGFPTWNPKRESLGIQVDVIHGVSATEGWTTGPRRSRCLHSTYVLAAWILLHLEELERYRIGESTTWRYNAR